MAAASRRHRTRELTGREVTRLGQRAGMSLDGVTATRDFREMGVRVFRVGRRWPKRYEATVTPPEGNWSTNRPVGRQRLNWKLRKITHPTDFWDLVNAADIEYERRGS